MQPTESWVNQEMFVVHTWLAVLIALVKSVSLSLAGASHMIDRFSQIDCRYENAGLHIYMDQIESCLP